MAKTSTVIDKKALRAVLLRFSEKYRGGKFTRVANNVYEDAEAHMRIWAQQYVRTHPSVGKTLSNGRPHNE